MKSTYKLILLACLISVAFLTQCTPSAKVAPFENGEVLQMANDRQFVFVPDMVLPMRGNSRTLTSNYSITIKKDSLISYLPYFGRATNAQINTTGSPLEFVSTHFNYEFSSSINDRHIIIVKPSDVNNIQTLQFTIFGNGSATLNVTNTNSDPISFNGKIRRIK